MDKNQIAQIKGSLTNYMINNPSFVTEVFAKYSDNLPWLVGIADPAATATRFTMFLNALTGDIFQQINDPGDYTWQKICNLFDTHSSRWCTKIVSYQDVNAVVGISNIFELIFPSLKANEFISSWALQLIESFNTAVPEQNFYYLLLDRPNGLIISNGSITDNPDSMPEFQLQNYNLIKSNYDLTTERNLKLQIETITSDLFITGLLKLHYKIETFPDVQIS